jgi:hypothetical protein
MISGLVFCVGGKESLDEGFISDILSQNFKALNLN